MLRVSFILLLVLLASCSNVDQNQEYLERIQALQDANRQLQGQIDLFYSQVSQLNMDLTVAVSEAEESMDVVVAASRELGSRSDDLREKSQGRVGTLMSAFSLMREYMDHIEAMQSANHQLQRHANLFRGQIHQLNTDLTLAVAESERVREEGITLGEERVRKFWSMYR